MLVHRVVSYHLVKDTLVNHSNTFINILSYTTDIPLPFLSIGEEKMSPLSKKRGHHDLRILRFERIASTAAVRTPGDFWANPKPISFGVQPDVQKVSD